MLSVILPIVIGYVCFVVFILAIMKAARRADNHSEHYINKAKEKDEDERR